jgi:hypothetical protein
MPFERRIWLWVAGAATLALLGVLTAIDLRIQDTGGPGIVSFEFSGSEEQVAETLGEWGEEGRDDARLSLWLDFAYMLSYAAFLALAIAALRDSASRRGWSRYARAGATLIYFPLLAAGFDAAENAGLLLALGGYGGDAAPLVAAICATIKFALSLTAIAYLLGGLARLALARARPA